MQVYTIGTSKFVSQHATLKQFEAIGAKDKGNTPSNYTILRSTCTLKLAIFLVSKTSSTVNCVFFSFKRWCIQCTFSFFQLI